jgi:hypothetical protein
MQCGRTRLVIHGYACTAPLGRLICHPCSMVLHATSAQHSTLCHRRVQVRVPSTQTTESSQCYRLQHALKSPSTATSPPPHLTHHLCRPQPRAPDRTAFYNLPTLLASTRVLTPPPHSADGIPPTMCRQPLTPSRHGEAFARSSSALRVDMALIFFRRLLRT